MSPRSATAGGLVVVAVETGDTTSRDGTGFGLSIVRRIARAHGWTVTLTEAADGGACVEFRGIEPAEPDEDGADGDSEQTVSRSSDGDSDQTV